MSILYFIYILVNEDKWLKAHRLTFVVWRGLRRQALGGEHTFLKLASRNLRLNFNQLPELYIRKANYLVHFSSASVWNKSCGGCSDDDSNDRSKLWLYEVVKCKALGLSPSGYGVR